MDDQTSQVQWQGTEACMDLNCEKCGLNSHIHTSGQMEIACVGCGTRYSLGRVTLHDMGAKHYEGVALPHIDDLKAVCERMDAAGNLTEDEKHAVTLVLDCEFDADCLPIDDRVAILKWAGRQHEDER